MNCAYWVKKTTRDYRIIRGISFWGRYAVTYGHDSMGTPRVVSVFFTRTGAEAYAGYRNSNNIAPT